MSSVAADEEAEAVNEAALAAKEEAAALLVTQQAEMGALEKRLAAATESLLVFEKPAQVVKETLALMSGLKIQMLGTSMKAEMVVPSAVGLETPDGSPPDDEAFVRFIYFFLPTH